MKKKGICSINLFPFEEIIIMVDGEYFKTVRNTSSAHGYMLEFEKKGYEVTSNFLKLKR